MKSKWFWIFAVVACLLLLVVAIAGVLRQRQDAQQLVGPVVDTGIEEDTVEAPAVVATPSLSKALGLQEEDMVEVGGVKRPKRDLFRSQHDPIAIRSKYLASLPEVGLAPTVSKTDSPAAAKLLEESSVLGKHLYKSTFSKAEPFDQEAYLASPEKYLVLTRPGRIRQSLPSGKGIVPLQTGSGQYFEVLQGESTFLIAKAEPGMPVTFHTQQLGEFENRLKTISVAANKDGLAKVQYKAVSGVIGQVHVVAASPVHSGRLTYVVDVQPPE